MAAAAAAAAPASDSLRNSGESEAKSGKTAAAAAAADRKSFDKEQKQKNEAFWRNLLQEIGVQQQQPPPPPKTWKDKLACFGFVCLAALVASEFGYRMYMDYNYGFETIDTSDAQMLKEVMFGGKPWMVLCRWPHKRSKVPDAINRSRIELLKVLRMGRLDCAAALPSGVRFAERFRIPSSSEGFVVANGKAPRLLTAWALQSAEQLLAYVQRHAKLDFRSVDDNGSLGRRCLLPAGSRCLFLLRYKGISTTERNKQIQTLFANIHPAVRKLKFAVLDSHKHQLNLHGAAPLAAAADPSETQIVCFLNTTKREQQEELRRKDDLSKHSFAVSVFEGSFQDTAAVQAFASRCASAAADTEGFVAMQQHPTVRRVQQQQQQQQQQGEDQKQQKKPKKKQKKQKRKRQPKQQQQQQ
ncbi:hypothetical protein, conserved [Eimeria tenella]|uniref:Uncharacterized protein n=1 Tax=Eimeria tenella TaxID=5802 RepID=U6KZJ6_EIMTE|nr:hypothetical protein, conserved [Eimeria tenella]CDJ41754.1 hypothetical protein, conserved [Eimeria tenella]|eukprot:XP_013232504.1 hypothetical protein, conserved [Eimeria tenella]